jgi:hypothetical protein
MMDDMLASPEAFKAKLTVLLSDPERSVSTIYLWYVRPFGESIEQFSPLLLHPDSLQRHPAGVVKVRLFLYQLMVQLELYAASSIDDPLSSDDYAIALDLAQPVCPLAFAINEHLICAFFAELRTVHGARWPLTIAKIESDLGVAQVAKMFELPDHPIHRLHFQEGRQPEKRMDDKPLQPHPLFPGRSTQLNKTVRIHIKRTRHGPSAEQIRPLLGGNLTKS